MTPLRVRRRPPSAGAALLGATQEQLLALVADGEAEALYQLYRRHGALVYAAAGRVGGPQIATEVTRALFLRLWADPRSYARGEDSLRASLLAQAHADAVQLLEHAPDDAGQRDLHAAEALAALPPSESSALTLVAFGGCTFREAAALLDEPPPVIRRRVLHAFRFLSGATTAQDASR